MKTATISKRSSGRRAFQPRVHKRALEALNIKNILVPIDFSKPSLSAVEFALPLVKRFGANLHLAHVFEPDYPLSSMAALPLIVPELEVGRRVRRHLKDVARKHSLELRRENIHAVRGKPFAEICRLARDREIDLIVVATRGNTGLKHLALGSTAERVVRYSPCPVLVVRGVSRNRKANRNGWAQRALTFEKILVPIDFSNCSMKGLSYAKALARQFRSKLILLNSVALQYWVTNDEYARYDLPLLTKQSEKIAREQMRDLVQNLEREGLEVISSVEIGHAGQEICAKAERNRIDVIVTSTHGTTGLKHILLGSTAEYVVRHASCPVVVVPSHERLTMTSKRK
jgi:nucleotide-binding universal stress UspA family protein